MYLPAGPPQPEPAELEAFWQAACEQSPELVAGRDFHVRWIGLDHASTEEVIALIESGDKTGTFTLPWIVERTDHPDPRAGDPVILIDYSGRPRLLLRLTKVYCVLFGDITAENIAIDGTPVRSPEIWRPLHIQYWNRLLEEFDLEVSDDMPVLVEHFETLTVGRG